MLKTGLMMLTAGLAVFAASLVAPESITIPFGGRWHITLFPRGIGVIVFILGAVLLAPAVIGWARNLRSTLLVGVCALLSVASAAAQTRGSDSMPLPQAFVGAGAGPATNDAASRMRLYEEGLAAVWLVEAGAAVSERVGVGVEYSQPSAATAFTTIGAGRAQIAGRQKERVLLGLVRARVAGMNRWALDLVGGAGILFQHHESGGCEPAQNRCEDTDDMSLDERTPAFAIGLDVPVRVARHLEIAADVRAYFLRRGEHTSESDINLSWQYEWRSSTRAAVAIVGRVVW